jgi:hypothetical protein
MVDSKVANLSTNNKLFIVFRQAPFPKKEETAASRAPAEETVLLLAAPCASIRIGKPKPDMANCLA